MCKRRRGMRSEIEELCVRFFFGYKLVNESLTVDAFDAS